uniref:Uncharacterized protein n=1 Tax=Cannabis sativa TaxID=3483 RepID=A0A803Q289_CANSA
MHRTAPTQLFLNHAQVFAGYRKENLNIGDLVTMVNCKRPKLILESQSIDDFNLFKVLCPNVWNPGSEKALRVDIILSAEEKYNKIKLQSGPNVCSQSLTLEPPVQAPSEPEVVLIDEEEEEVVPLLDRKHKGVITEPEPLKKLKKVNTPSPSVDLGISFEVDEYLAPPSIILTPAHPDEERVQLRIAKHNYIVRELSRGDAEAKALKKWLREAQDGPFREMVSHFAANLTQLLTKRYATCASSNPVYQIQDMSVALTARSYNRLTWRQRPISVKLKELCEFWDQTRKEAAKAARDILLALITCKDCEKCFEDGVFMCWKANKFEPRLPFFPKPKAVIAQF